MAQAWLGLALVVVETGAQTGLQEGATGNGCLWVAMGIVGYAVVALIYFVLLNRGAYMGVVNTLWNAGTGITVALVGLFFFKQQLTPMQWVGLAMAVGGSLLLTFGVRHGY